MIVYHSQIDDFFERRNPVIKIALRYYIQVFNKVKNWSSIIKIMQRTINNDVFFSDKLFNEICYDFTFVSSTDFLNLSVYSIINVSSTKIAIADSIAMTQITPKKYTIENINHWTWKWKIEFCFVFTKIIKFRQQSF